MLEPPLSWISLFVLTCYLMGLAALYRCFVVGCCHGWWRGFREMGLLMLFCGLAYSVESWAHARTPYYYYSSEFPDRVRRLRVEKLPIYEPPPTTVCGTNVTATGKRTLGEQSIPISIPIMEGSLAFAALWMSRYLKAPVVLRPFLAGMVLVNVDILLDPVVATTHSCDGTLLREGLGFWHWYIDDTVIAHLYGIPLFNFAGWYGAALLLVALAYLLGWGSEAGRWLAPTIFHSMARGEPPSLQRAALWLTLVGAPAWVLSYSPSLKVPPSLCLQWFMLLIMVVGTGTAALFAGRRFCRDQLHQIDLTLITTLPVLFTFVALFGSGQFMQSPTFLFVALVTGGTALLLSWLPYQEAVCRAGQRLVDLDRFIRLHFVGYPWMLVLLGAAHPTISGSQVAGLMVVALCFHVHSCVMNDAIDLEMDKTQVRRQADPLVRGAVDATTARVFSLLQLPIGLAVSVFLGAGPLALGMIVLACCLMAVYNRWGKRCPVPPLTDAVQGIAWGLLALYGAVIVGGLDPLAWVVFAYGAGFMTLINGIHGGLRDAANDQACCRRNTALFFGATPGGDPFTIASTPKLAVFAFAVHSVLIGLMALLLWSDALAYRMPVTGAILAPHTHRVVWWCVVGLFSYVAVCSHVLLWQLVRPGEARRDAAGSMHAFVILLPPLIVLTPTLGPTMQVVVPVSYLLPLLFQFVEPILGRIFPAVRQEFAKPPARPPIPLVRRLPTEAS